MNKVNIEEQVKKFIGDFGIYTPFPVSELAEYKGFKVVVFKPSKEETENISGAISYDKKIILVNDNDSDYRKRFTIAHELGHLALHEEDGDMVDYRNNADAVRPKKEIEANAFAAELLMPKDIFMAIYKEYKKEKQIYLLRDVFGVSLDDIRIRAENLKL